MSPPIWPSQSKSSTRCFFKGIKSILFLYFPAKKPPESAPVQGENVSVRLGEVTQTNFFFFNKITHAGCDSQREAALEEVHPRRQEERAAAELLHFCFFSAKQLLCLRGKRKGLLLIYISFFFHRLLCSFNFVLLCQAWLVFRRCRNFFDPARRLQDIRERICITTTMKYAINTLNVAFVI